MAIACPIDLDTLRLRAEIKSIYARVAADPLASSTFIEVRYAATAARLRRRGTVEDSSAGVGVVCGRR